MVYHTNYACLLQRTFFEFFSFSMSRRRTLKHFKKGYKELLFYTNLKVKFSLETLNRYKNISCFHLNLKLQLRKSSIIFFMYLRKENSLITFVFCAFLIAWRICSLIHIELRNIYFESHLFYFTFFISTNYTFKI